MKELKKPQIIFPVPQYNQAHIVEGVLINFGATPSTSLQFASATSRSEHKS